MSAAALDLARDTIFVGLSGSHAHGTARSGSDVDLRGVCVAPLALRLSLFERFQQWEGGVPPGLEQELVARLAAHPSAARNLGVRRECVVYDIAKFLRLLAGANPNALEILFTHPGDWLHETPVWRRLHAERQRFLTREVQRTYLGYALAQLRKIATHRAWLLSPPSQAPTRKELGLPDTPALSREERQRVDAYLAERARNYGVSDLELPPAARATIEERIDRLVEDLAVARRETRDETLAATAAAALGLPHGVIEILLLERKYEARRRHYASYLTWQTERNPERAALERAHGYDTKHGMHLMRLLRTGLELLETGELHVRRPDAEELRRVRAGALSYEDLVAEAEALAARMQRRASQSALPERVAPEFVDALCLELFELHRPT